MDERGGTERVVGDCQIRCDAGRQSRRVSIRA
jgi:hypothetical protein